MSRKDKVARIRQTMADVKQEIAKATTVAEVDKWLKALESLEADIRALPADKRTKRYRSYVGGCDWDSGHASHASYR